VKTIQRNASICSLQPQHDTQETKRSLGSKHNFVNMKWYNTQEHIAYQRSSHQLRC